MGRSVLARTRCVMTSLSARTALMSWTVGSKRTSVFTTVTTKVDACLQSFSAMESGTVWMAQMRPTVVGWLDLNDCLEFLLHTWRWVKAIGLDPSDDREAEVIEKNTGTTSVYAAPEASLPIQCAFQSKPCKNQMECVHHMHFCDGEDDCSDGSDEEDCSFTCEAGEILLWKADCDVIFKNSAL